MYFTVDLEQDCPPYMQSMRGMEEGLPRLLELLEQNGVRATFFATGDVALRYPRAIEDLVTSGHELGCHGMTHARFTRMSHDAARTEIGESTRILRGFARVTSFRAPYLSLREDQLPILEELGYEVDASRARYKPAHWLRPRAVTRLLRLEASVTPSLLRLPARVRDPILLRVRTPLVLFVHPWEFIRLTGEKSLPLDCRFNTGHIALTRLAEVFRLFGERGTAWRTVSQLATSRAAA